MADQSKIKNFTIIAHIDHGKSTLADRMLEITKTVEDRKMKDQVLDNMELERERGITIKMQPVRMKHGVGGDEYTLNLIDTPGHIDFFYEVSRALKAVEGSILLVDATQGIQAQTISTLNMAKELNHVVVPVISKIDSPLADVSRVKKEIVDLLGVEDSEILTCSGKTGEGVKEVIEEVISRIPSPTSLDEDATRSLVFDFEYSSHKGIVVYVRVVDGEIKKGDQISLIEAKQNFTALEVGIFAPEKKSKEKLMAGEIGYIVTGIKSPGVASVGDTITLTKKQSQSLGGYMTPKPVVWASVYPEDQNDFAALKLALDRLRLSDASLAYEEESSGILGRGFRCGFLGMLHLEIVTERLKREHKLELIVTSPSISYEVTDKAGKTEIYYSPALLPEFGTIQSIREAWVDMKIILPSEYLGEMNVLLYDHEAEVGNTISFSDERTEIELTMPLRELMRNFFDKIKSVTSGYASFSYTIGDLRDADVTKLEVLVAGEVVPAFTKVVSKKKLETEAEKVVEKLYKILPRQLFVTKIQAQALGRIISSRTLSALRKDVTGYLYGGDVTRKMKLLEKQKKGKKKMKARGKVNIPQDVFMKMVKSD